MGSISLLVWSSTMNVTNLEYISLNEEWMNEELIEGMGDPDWS